MRLTDRPTSCRRLQRQLIRLVDRRTVEGSQSTTLSESLKLVDVLVAAVVCAVSCMRRGRDGQRAPGRPSEYLLVRIEPFASLTA